MRLYPPPFDAGTFYLLPHLWLDDLTSPLELDARELVLAQHSGADNLAAFPPEAPIHTWVRENEDGRPRLMAHPTFRLYLDAMFDDTPGRGALLRTYLGFRDCFEIAHWPDFAGRAVIYRPRSYIVQRWPAWFGEQWQPRAALIGILGLATERPTVDAAGSITIEVTTAQVRGAAERALPPCSTDRVGVGLAQLASMGVVTPVERSANASWYRFTSSTLDQSPQLSFEDVAAAARLDPVQDAHWVELVQAFLRYNCLAVARAGDVMRQILHYDPDIATPEDAVALVQSLQARAGHTSTSVSIVLKEFVKKKQRDHREWLWSEPFAVKLDAEYCRTPYISMPSLDGPDVHLQTTQLILRYRRHARLSAVEAVALATGVEIEVLQQNWNWVICSALQPTLHTVRTQSRLDCNRLHGVLDYAEPFRLVTQIEKPTTQLTLEGQFRIRVT